MLVAEINCAQSSDPGTRASIGTDQYEGSLAGKIKGKLERFVELLVLLALGGTKRETWRAELQEPQA